VNGSGVANLVRTTSSTNFTWPATFGRRHHSHPYSILYASLWRLYPNVTSKIGSPKIGSFVVPQLWTFTFLPNQVFFANTSEISYSPQKDLSNGV
jgi:hypothetical protein